MQRENKQIPVGWQLVDDQGLAKLTREFKFPDFQAALQFTNQVGAMAEKYHHHPLIELEWGRVAVWWWTHKTHGLTDLDHRLADQTSQLFDGASAV